MAGYRIYGKSDTGLVRKNNEDAIVIKADVFVDNILTNFHFLSAKENVPFLAIADGMGGESAGEIASSIALETVQAFLQHNLVLNHDEDEILACLELALLEAHKNILMYASNHSASLGMGTTAVAALITGNKVFCSWVGDSRMYLYSPHFSSAQAYKQTGLLHLITDDHSIVWQEVKKGMLQPEEARKSSRSNIIIQSLGDPLQQPCPESTVVEIREGDVLLFCSDGLNGMVSEKNIENTLSKAWKMSPQTLVEDLIVKSKVAGGRDNVTVIICAYGKEEGGYILDPHPLTKQLKQPLPETVYRKTLYLLTVIAVIVAGWALSNVQVPQENLEKQEVEEKLYQEVERDTMKNENNNSNPTDDEDEF